MLDKTESQARTKGLSVTAGVIAQVRFVELFLNDSGVNDDQFGEFGNYSRLRARRVGKSD